MKNLLNNLTIKEQFRNILGNKTKNDERLKSVSDVLKPIRILSIIFGLRVFEFPRDQSRPILSFLYSMLLCFLYYVAWVYYEKSFYRYKVFNFDGIVSRIIYITDHMVIFLIILLGLRQSKESKLFVKRINEIDKTLKALGSTSYFNNIYKTTIRDLTIAIFYFILYTTIIFLRMILTNNEVYNSYVLYLSLFIHVYNFSIENLMVLEFITIVRCIKSGFQRANELLGDVEILPISSIASELNDERTKMNDLFINKRLFPINSTKLFITLPSSLHRTQSRLQIVTTKQNKSRTLLRTIRQVHLELFKLSKELSKMYGIQVSLEISMCILFGIFVLYHFYTQYLRQSYDIEKNFVQLILTFLSMIQLAVKIFIINYTCEKTTEEAENTNEILHTFYGQNTNLKIKNEVDIFTLQMMQHRTEYSAYGFFKLNCKYICSCIGTVTTYIVIMIQVTDSIKEVS